MGTQQPTGFKGGKARAQRGWVEGSSNGKSDRLMQIARHFKFWTGVLCVEGGTGEDGQRLPEARLEWHMGCGSEAAQEGGWGQTKAWLARKK